MLCQGVPFSVNVCGNSPYSGELGCVEVCHKCHSTQMYHFTISCWVIMIILTCHAMSISFDMQGWGVTNSDECDYTLLSCFILWWDVAFHQKSCCFRMSHAILTCSLLYWHMSSSYVDMCYAIHQGLSIGVLRMCASSVNSMTPWNIMMIDDPGQYTHDTGYHTTQQCNT